MQSRLKKVNARVGCFSTQNQIFGKDKKNTQNQAGDSFNCHDGGMMWHDVV
jgi:hypothetical protein